MKNKKLDFCMLIMGLAVLAAFVISIMQYGRDLKLAEKKVESIADIKVPEVPAVTTTRLNGVISAEEWSSHYPEIYASYMQNADNKGHGTVRVSYLETDPDIKVIYDGIGFSKDYGEAIGHNYTLEDVYETQRPHKLANCLTCKTPDMTAMVNNMGTQVYSEGFDTVFAQVSEPISCYNCHANTPGTIVITHDYMANAMGDEIEAGKVPASSVSCAQCHIEYYFDPDTKATTAPYSTLEEMSPDAILAYYNEMGFVDFTNSNTEVGMIKVQHPEFETYYGEGSQHAGTYTCADCHMGVAYNKDGDPYASHNLISPLENTELLISTCSVCHKDLKGQVKEIQDQVTAREKEVSALLVKLNEELAKAITDGRLSEETLAQVKKLDRDAQFYWDFVFVENAEGAHNSKLSHACLDKAEELIRQALELLK
nr:ammonia-forming cytochrome c nitrite reductase subunit c552 [Lachnospiraceae bacterium]